MATITVDGEQNAIDAPGNTTSRTTADFAQDTLGAQDTHDTEDPVHAVLDTAELHEMILQNLSTKDLARSLAVSKHWRSSALSSTMLRRKLFLDPDPRREYFSLELSIFVREETATSRSIHEPHPILRLHTASHAKTTLKTRGASVESLRTVHPATLLFQPPLDNITVVYGGYVKPGSCIGGVTFGQLEKVLRHAGCHKGRYAIFHSKALASNAEVVMDARKARAELEASTGLE